MKVIFLDVDGVLNYQNSNARIIDGTYFVDDEKLLLLKEMVDQTGAQLVLSSSWRRGWTASVGEDTYKRADIDDSKSYFMLCAKLHDIGLNLLSEIPRLSYGNREDAINYWLREWPGEKVEAYVILDDDADKFSPDNRHLIQTSIEVGLMPEHIEAALQILDIAMHKKKVLIVDDLEINRAVIRAMLEQKYQTLEAVEGQMALEVLEENKDIAAVITDLQMPVMNGFVLIRKIRENLAYDAIAIIANTQYGDPEQEEYVLEMGADDFIYKPSSPKVVKMRVNNAIRLKSSRVH